jgi:F-type H+-transporting ATPase subunit b
MTFGLLLAEETPPTGLVVHPFWVVVSIVNFLVILYLLRRYLWGPILTVLATRAEKIREGLEMAEAAKVERERMKAEVERLLADARRDAQAIAERMTNAAEAASAEIRAQAKTEADRIRERGREDAKQLHDQALAQLRTELAGMVVLAASRVLGREVDAAQHRTLIERSLDEAAAQLTEQS